jgi:hypothetical protein
VSVLLEAMLNDSLPKASRKLLTAGRLIPITKPTGGVRPIVVFEPLLNLACSCLLEQMKQTIEDWFVPFQYGVQVSGGVEAVVHQVNNLIQTDPENVVLKVDLENAFGSVSRQAVLSQIKGELSALRGIANFMLKDKNLVQYRQAGYEFEREEGVDQGGILASLFFCLVLQPVLRAAGAIPGVTVMALVDDVHIVGHPADVAQSFDIFVKKAELAGLDVGYAKTKLLLPRPQDQVSIVPPHPQIKVVHHAMETLGAPIGYGKEYEAFAINHVEQVIKTHDALIEILKDSQLPAQEAMYILRLCVQPRLTYLMRVVPSDIILPLCQRWDDIVYGVFCARMEIKSTPKVRAQVELPVRIGGMGLRSTARTCHAAYVASVMRTVHDFKMRVGRPTRFSVYLSVARTALLKEGILPIFLPRDYTPEEVDKVYSSMSTPSKMQKFFQVELDRMAWSQLKFGLGEKDKVRMDHLAGNRKGANAWLTCIPADADRTLPSKFYAAAVRFRLGVQQVKGLPPKCLCGEELSADHFVACVNLRRYQHTKRHDSIAKAIAKFTRRVGLDTTVEPRDGGVGLRPDIQLTTTQGGLYIDVSVCHPLAKSYIKPAAKNPAPMEKRETQKIKKYEQYVKDRGPATFLPAVFSSYGAIGEGAAKVFSLIEQCEDPETGRGGSRKLVKELKEVVAISIQRGNAEALLYGSIQAINAVNEAQMPRPHASYVPPRRRVVKAAAKRLSGLAARRTPSKRPRNESLAVEIQQADGDGRVHSPVNLLDE